MSSPAPDPQRGQLWSTSKGRTVEILARDMVDQPEHQWQPEAEIDVVAYKFLGGSMVHLRSVDSLTGWSRAVFE